MDASPRPSSSLSKSRLLGRTYATVNTCAIPSNSAAFNAGDDTIQNAPDLITTDQRGLARKSSTAVDIGAYELDVAQPGPTYTVNSLDDPGDGIPGLSECTLREALAAANASADNTSIGFKAGLIGTIFLTSPLSITNPVTVNGPGARLVAVSGNNRVREVINPARKIFGTLRLFQLILPGAQREIHRPQLRMRRHAP